MIMCGKLNWSILRLFNSVVFTAMRISVEWRTEITMNEGKNFYEGSRGLFERSSVRSERMNNTTKILSTDGNLHENKTEHEPTTLQFAWWTTCMQETAWLVGGSTSVWSSHSPLIDNSIHRTPQYVQIPKRSSLPGQSTMANVHKLSRVDLPFW
jgi:hypothetical protein